MYDILFTHPDFTPPIRSQIGIQTLDEAKSHRSSGYDFVVFSGTTAVVPDEGWLFDWERGKPEVYVAASAVVVARLLNVVCPNF